MDESEAQQQPIWPELEEIARPARERRRLPPEVRSQIIVSLCRRAPLSVKDLSHLLDRSEAYVGDAIRPLVTSGSLTFLYPDQPRHPRQKYIAASQVMPAAVAPAIVEEPELSEEIDTFLAPSAAPAAVRPIEALPETPFREVTQPRDFPNQASNIVFAIAVGAILGFTNAPFWWLIALILSLGLSALHIARESAQFQQFSNLRFMRSRNVGFMLLKTTVAFLEIAIVYALVRILFGAE